MDNKKDGVSKLLSFDVIIEKRKKENSEIFENDFDDNIYMVKHKKPKPKNNNWINYFYYYLFE